MRDLLFRITILVSMLLSATARLASAPVELAFDIWDWTPPARDLQTFEQWVGDLQKLGFNRVEMSVPWRTLEPEPGQYQMEWLQERQKICKQHGMGMRLRINSYWGGALPDWYPGDIWMDAEQKQAFGFRVPSINDARFWESFGPLCTAIAASLQDEDVIFSPFIGIHAELKYADWWTYDPSSMELWRESIQSPRPAWLKRLVADADLPTTPPVPASTSGLPDQSPASVAFIGFREWTLRTALQKFVTAVRQGDPDARISSPLGESFRRESALMANQDYWGLSRGSAQVVHSYDFMLHPGTSSLWPARATLAAFQGITQLPVSFEFDSPVTMEKGGYDESVQKQLVDLALDAGAGLKFANFSGSPKLPSEWPVLRYAGEQARQRVVMPIVARPEDTVLLFFSKWANYLYREPGEWLHEAQFGWWKLLDDLQIPSRIICENNLCEDLSSYRAAVFCFSPLDLLPRDDQEKIEQLQIPRLHEYSRTPTLRPDGDNVIRSAAGSITVPADLPFPSLQENPTSGTSPLLQGNDRAYGVLTAPRCLELGFPLGYTYLHSGNETHRQIAVQLLKAITPGNGL